MLTPAGLTNILENYAQIVEEKDPRTGKKKRKQVWPRYHQLGVVRQALADVRAHGAGKRYLIQHSAGSGKSNSIAWLAHQLIGLKRDDKEVFDSVIVVTDRRLLDDQIQTTIKQFMQVGATVGHAERSGDLRKFIEEGKKIIVSTVQKFPFILDEIATEGGKTFAIVIDEAHSSQGGKTSAAMSQALGAAAEDEDAGPDPEDTVNEALEKRMAARKMLTNASYFAFTATPKNKTLEMFGEPLPPDAEGKVKHRPFHSYTMKQAIEEGFILDVLKELHAGGQLLQAGQEDRGRPGVRHQEGAEEAAPVCRRATTTRSGSRPRSWWTTSTSRCWRLGRSAGRRGRWWSRAASSGPSSTSTPSRRISWSARARTRRSSPSRASTTTAARRSARCRSTASRAARSPPRSRPTRTAS